MKPDLAGTFAEADAHLVRWREAGARVVLVPTAGNLHPGHLALVDAAREGADRVILSILDERSGAPAERLNKARETDLAMLESSGADLVFLPDRDEVFPQQFATHISVGDLSETLCGEGRPGYFDEICTHTLKLINGLGPGRIFLAEKDWQKIQILRRMVVDLNLSVEIVNGPAKRAEDGLVYACANRLLSDEARVRAPALFEALARVAGEICSGRPTELACAEAEDRLLAAGFSQVEYLECRDAQTLRIAMAPFDRARVFGAAHIGGVRLIDNVQVMPG